MAQALPHAISCAGRHEHILFHSVRVSRNGRRLACLKQAVMLGGLEPLHGGYDVNLSDG